jgi:hypothetical protein
MLTHDGWVNGDWYESLFARRRRPTRRAIPTARKAVRAGLSGGWYQMPGSRVLARLTDSVNDEV